MKSEDQVKEQRTKVLEELAVQGDEKGRDYLQGYIAALTWITLEESQEEVKND